MLDVYFKIDISFFTTINVLYQFLGLSWHPALDKFISEHMMVEEAASKQGAGYISGQSEVSSRSPTLCTTPYFGQRRKVLLRTILYSL